MVCGMMFDSAIRSYATKLLPDSEQGSLQGTLSALTLLCNVVAGFTSNLILGFFISDRAPTRWPGGHFLLASVLFAVAALQARFVLRKYGALGAQGPPL